MNILGSGSNGNSALLITPDAHVLIDIGFSPIEIDKRLAGTGASWETLDAVVLTHMHADHIKKQCFTRIARHEIMFFCHAAHVAQLKNARGFKKLVDRGLVRTYDSDTFEATSSVHFKPLRVPHDSEPTYGFRIEAALSGGRIARMGYLSDLGECDEHIERSSGRHPNLIARVLGRDGHLSNRQAAEIFRKVLQCGKPAPKFLIQLHLSRECNRAELAYQSAQEVLMLCGGETQVFSTRQERRGTVHRV